MKVYVLHYSYYDESEIKGVYSEEAMKKEKAQYAELAKSRNVQMIEEQEKRIELLKARRYQLGQRDREIQKQQSKLKAKNIKADSVLKSERKRLMKEMSQLMIDIQNQERGLEKMKSLTHEQLAEQEMHRGHLYFEEFYVLK